MKKILTTAVLTLGAFALTACGTGASLDGGGASGSAGVTGGSASRLVVGSQDYYSNEIIAETYAQALEAGGFSVERQMRIGQREVYMPEVTSGSIDVFPDYTGNLLAYLNPEATATESAQVYEQLRAALPQGVVALEQASATDQDSYVVTAQFADDNNVRSIGDLVGVNPLVIGGNSELETRPYGPVGLLATYGVSASFTPIEDSGGPLTVKALRDGSVQVADIYSSDPVLAQGDLRVLEDPQHLFRASHVVPLVSAKVDENAAAIINSVSQALTPEALIEMNRASTVDQKSASTIAREWLISTGIVS